MRLSLLLAESRTTLRAKVVLVQSKKNVPLYVGEGHGVGYFDSNLSNLFKAVSHAAAIEPHVATLAENFLLI